ncbi:hypothetical protein RJ53_08010 [Methanocalculus chunghsingensis]|uniref:Uncharacterized protein n=1 Tax=Methanocalculus chunghsingensis TaxID=156457 RepID=A0A8J7WAQ8_9EURY|nr:hypothetical protein [Methanocalculus chunghsingensis]MBR1369440.1 hypothetical protein [Methanocalculus chunghsingensis]
MVHLKKPCCAADALRRIRQIDIGGISVGLVLLDEIINKVLIMNLESDDRIAEELIKYTKIFNYIPPSAEETYCTALMREYRHKVKP